MAGLPREILNTVAELVRWSPAYDRVSETCREWYLVTRLGVQVLPPCPTAVTVGARRRYRRHLLPVACGHYFSLEGGSDLDTAVATVAHAVRRARAPGSLSLLRCLTPRMVPIMARLEGLRRIKVREIRPDAVGALAGLVGTLASLDLSRCHHVMCKPGWSTLHRAIAGSRLEVLGLSGVCAGCGDGSTQPMPSGKLVELDMSSNGTLGKVVGAAPLDLPALQRLNVRDCHLTSLDLATLVGQLPSLCLLDAMGATEQANIAYGVGRLWDAVDAHPRLACLRLRGRSTPVLGGLGRLTTLDCSDNRHLDRSDARRIMAAPRLERLDLSGLQATELDPPERAVPLDCLGLGHTRLSDRAVRAVKRSGVARHVDC